jgi:hypothetical protein
MNEKENKKMDELSQKLEAIDQQEAQTHPMTGTRRWFFRALTFGIGGAILGKSFITEAASICRRSNKNCESNACYTEGNVCIQENFCKLINNCFYSNTCSEINLCNANVCSESNICGVYDVCMSSNTCTKINK